MPPLTFQQTLTNATRTLRNYKSYIDAFDNDLKSWMSFPVPLNDSDIYVMNQQAQAMRESRGRMQHLINNDVLSLTIHKLQRALLPMPHLAETSFGGNSHETNNMLVRSLKFGRNEQYERLLRLTEIYDMAKGEQVPTLPNMSFQDAFPLLRDEDVELRPDDDLTNEIPESLRHMLTEDEDSDFDGTPNDAYVNRLQEELQAASFINVVMQPNFDPFENVDELVDIQRRRNSLESRLISARAYRNAPVPRAEMHEGQMSHPTPSPHHVSLSRSAIEYEAMYGPQRDGADAEEFEAHLFV
jgi:hypothetical protein